MKALLNDGIRSFFFNGIANLSLHLSLYYVHTVANSISVKTLLMLVFQRVEYGERWPATAGAYTRRAKYAFSTILWMHPFPCFEHCTRHGSW